MPKGKTNQPLTIWVADRWRKHEVVLALEAMGHTVYSFEEVAQYGARYDNKVWLPDLIWHPAAHNWSDVMFQEHEKKDGTKYNPFVDAALAAARARKRGKK